MTAASDLDGPALRAVIDRIIPADDDPGALELGTDGYVLHRMALEPAFAAAVADGLAILRRLAGNEPFETLPPDRRDALLLGIETEPWFARLIEVVAEGFWADPDNGGNRDARSWAIIGYLHGLPEGPSGPPEQARP